MKIELKKIFCLHVYQTTKTILLDKWQVFQYDYPRNIEGWVKYKKVANYKICLKCEKESISKEILIDG